MLELRVLIRGDNDIRRQAAECEQQRAISPSPQLGEATLTLHIRDLNVGEAAIMTQPGKFGLGGGGLVVGRSGAEPVSDDYEGEAPWPFVGGTIRKVVIDVSGEPFADLAREAAAMFARE